MSPYGFKVDRFKKMSFIMTSAFIYLFSQWYLVSFSMETATPNNMKFGGMCPTYTAPANFFTIDPIFVEGASYKKGVCGQTKMLIAHNPFK